MITMLVIQIQSITPKSFLCKSRQVTNTLAVIRS